MLTQRRGEHRRHGERDVLLEDLGTAADRAMHAGIDSPVTGVDDDKPAAWTLYPNRGFRRDARDGCSFANLARRRASRGRIRARCGGRLHPARRTVELTYLVLIRVVHVAREKARHQLRDDEERKD